MRVLIAPDKFRGTFTSAEVCAHLSRGLLQELPSLEVEMAPLADGGEGTMEAVLAALGGTRTRVDVRGPLGDETTAEYGVTADGTAVLEAARFCGLQLVPHDQRDPMMASSYGLGQAVAAALDAGVRRFLIGLGGTATVDGGAGLALALGYRLEDSAGRQTGGRGGDLSSIVKIEASMARQDLAVARFTALCDVDNPLLGPRGAASVFGPQKGASPEDVTRLEDGLAALAAAIAVWKGTEFGKLARLRSGGAAGGLGLGCASFLDATLTPGSIFLMRTVGVAERIASADLVITGEGSFDSQTRGGKVAAAVLEAAALCEKPAVVVAGRWDGTLPATCPESLVVLTAQDIHGVSAQLSADDLVEMGRKTASRWRGLAKPIGR